MHRALTGEFLYWYYVHGWEQESRSVRTPEELAARSIGQVANMVRTLDSHCSWVRAGLMSDVPCSTFEGTQLRETCMYIPIMAHFVELDSCMTGRGLARAAGVAEFDLERRVRHILGVHDKLSQDHGRVLYHARCEGTNMLSAYLCRQG
jgi:hypothetical protein